MNKVLVGISGGIDSAATVLKLQEKGYEVEALYIDMLGSEHSIAEVKSLAAQLGVVVHIARASEMFENLVVQKVLEVHQSGGTPSPCTICNPQLKWRLLEKYADELGIYYIATGHYIQVRKIGERYYVVKGVDMVKDQSYYLYSMGQDVLKRALTPLGGFTKLEVRGYLEAKGFELLARGGESQGVCFAKRGYKNFLEERLSPKSGEVVDLDGNAVGVHDGYQYYTVGQKRGFELSDGVSGVEVRGVNVGLNRVIVGKAFYAKELVLGDAWYCLPECGCEGSLRAKIRGLGRNPDRDIRVEELSDSRLSVSLLGEDGEEFWAVAVGQPAVLYLGDVVVGGGVVV